jgi:hypothetical protein
MQNEQHDPKLDRGKGRGRKRPKATDVVTEPRDKKTRGRTKKKPDSLIETLSRMTLEQRTDPLLQHLQTLLDNVSKMELEKRSDGVLHVTNFVAQEFTSRPELVSQAANVLLHPKMGLLKCLEVTPRQSSKLKNEVMEQVAQALATTALYCYGAIEIPSFFSWAFLNLQTDAHSRILTSKEDCILLALAKLLAPHASLGLPFAQLPHIIDQVLLLLQNYLDGLKTVGLLGRVVDVMEVIGKHYPGPFNAVFEDVLDIFVGWFVEAHHVADLVVQKNTLERLDLFFKRLSGYWLNHVPFVCALLRKLLEDMERRMDLGVFSSAEVEWMDFMDPIVQQCTPPLDLLACFSSVFKACFHAVYAPVMDLHVALAQQVSQDSAEEVDLLIRWMFANAWRGVKVLPDHAQDYCLQWFTANHHLFQTIQQVIGPENFSFYQPLALRMYLVPLKSAMRPRGLRAFSVQQLTNWVETDWIVHPSRQLLEHLFVPSLTNSTFWDVRRGNSLEAFLTLLAPSLGKFQDENRHDFLDNFIGYTIALLKRLKGSVDEGMWPGLEDCVPLGWTDGMITHEVMELASISTQGDILQSLLDNVSHLSLAATSACDGIQQCSALVCPRKICWSFLRILAGPEARFMNAGWWSSMRNVVCKCIVDLAARRRFFLPGSCTHFSTLQVKSSESLSHSTILVVTLFFPEDAVSCLPSVLSFFKEAKDVQEEEFMVDGLLDSQSWPLDPNQRLAIVTVWQELVKHNVRRHPKHLQWIQRIIQGVNDVDVRVSDVCLRLLADVPMFHLVQEASVYHQVHSSNPPTTLSPANFSRILTHWGIPTNNRFTQDSFARLFSSTHLSDAKPQEILTNKTLQDHWMAWEMARFCVVNRLKTPLGGPMQTFEAFNRHLHVLQSQLMSNCTEMLISQCHEYLQFIQALELQIQNAAHGTALAQPPPVQKACGVFFNANDRVCSEWFIRIRPYCIRISAMVGHVAPRTIFHALHCLAERPDHNRDVVLSDLSKSFLSLNESDSLMGLAAWVKRCEVERHGPAPGSWIVVASLIAEGRLETSVDLLRKLVKFPEYSRQPGPVLDFVIKSVSDAYVHLADYEGMIEFLNWINDQPALHVGPQSDLGLDLIGKRLQSWTGVVPRPCTVPASSSLVLSSFYPDFRTRGLVNSELAMLDGLHRDKVQVIQQARSHALQLVKMDASPVSLEWSSTLSHVSMLDFVANTMKHDHVHLANDWDLHKAEAHLALQRVNLSSGLENDIVRLARKSANLNLAKRLLEDCPGMHVETAKVLIATGQANAAITPLIKALNDKDSSKPLRYLAKIAYNDLWKMWNHDVRLLAIRAVGAPSSKSNDSHILAEYALKRAIQENGKCPKAAFAMASWAYRRATMQLDNLVAAVEREDYSADLQILQSETNQRRVASLLLYELGAGVDPQLEALFSQQSLKENVEATSRGEQVLGWIEEKRREHVQFYRVAVKSYGDFLSMNSTVINDRQGAKEDCNQLTATLRLLRILIKHGRWLMDDFVQLLQCTPLKPWLPIIPQLFARLDHPDAWIRDQITNLVCRLARAHPSAIVYNAVVGYNAALQSDETIKTYNIIVAAVKENLQGVAILKHMQQVLDELGRLSVLWEEAWHGKLAHWDSDVSKRVQKFVGEHERVSGNADLTDGEKQRLLGDSYWAIMGPVVQAVKKLRSGTYGRIAETPHEMWFQHEYGPILDVVLDELETPSTYADVEQVWGKLKNIHSRLNKLTQIVRPIPMAQISPFLASLKSSQLPVPGVEQVSVQQFSPEVIILPTKTRPKRIAMLGSDGHTYMFLCKGLEDLHLDERMMQFVRVANQLLLKDKLCNSRHLSSRHYAVVPVGDKIGLIQWVNNITSIFSLYRHWQQMDLQTKQVAMTIGPHASYFTKLTEAMHPLNPKTMSRKSWPRAAVIRVFGELCKETPSDLIERELWTSSPTLIEWWAKHKSYARSLAVTSILGYIIGLGDRHLDNVMMDFSTGEVVHIDYNVCFDRGKKLRVPETVPFRLTQNFLGGLGLCGVDGLFRIAAEHVLRVARQNREVLMTLLEAFVYDPLVDWATDVAGDLERRMDDIEVSLSLMQNRFAEMRSLCTDAHDLLQRDVMARLQRVLNTAIPQETARIEVLSQYRIALKTIAETDPLVVKLSPVVEKVQMAEADRIKRLLQQTASNYTLQAAQHSSALAKLNKLEEFAADIVSTKPALMQPNHLTQGYQQDLTRSIQATEQAFVHVVERRISLYQTMIEHLSFYATLALPNMDTLKSMDAASRRATVLEPLLSPEASPENFAAAVQTLQPSNIDEVVIGATQSRLKKTFEHLMNRANKKMRQTQLVVPERHGKWDAVRKQTRSSAQLLRSVLLSCISATYDGFTSRTDRTGTSTNTLYDVDVEQCLELEMCPIVSQDVICALVMSRHVSFAHKSLGEAVLQLDEDALLNHLDTCAELALTLWDRLQSEAIFYNLASTVDEVMDEVKQMTHALVDMDEATLGTTSRTMMEKLIGTYQHLKEDISSQPAGKIMVHFDALFDPLAIAFGNLTSTPCFASAGYVSEQLVDSLHIRQIKCLVSLLESLSKFKGSIADFSLAFFSGPAFAEFRNEFANYMEFIAKASVEAVVTVFSSIVQGCTPESSESDAVDRMHRMIDRHITSGIYSRRDLDLCLVALLREVHEDWQFSTAATLQQSLKTANDALSLARIDLFGHQLIWDPPMSPTSDASVRSRIMDNLQSDLNLLKQSDQEMRHMQVRYDELEETMRGVWVWMLQLQPDVMASVSMFEQACKSRQAKFTLESRRSVTFGELCSSLLDFESSRLTGMPQDAELRKEIQTLEKVDAVGRAKRRHTSAANAIRLLQHAWSELKLTTVKKNLVKPWLEAKQVIDKMNLLMGELAPLAQTALRTGEGIGSVETRLVLVKQILRDWSELIKLVDPWVKSIQAFVDETQRPDYLILDVKRGIPYQASELPNVPAGLIDLLQAFLNQLPEAIASTMKPLAPEVTPETQTKSQSSVEVHLDKTAAPVKVQERNAYAVNMLRRVRNKLDGKVDVTDRDKRLSVADQVQSVIDQATSPDNLAAMFEGWTAWI